MENVLSEIISLITAGIEGIAGGIGSGLSTLVTEIFLTPGTDGVMKLSTFGGVIVVFAGIGLAVGLSRLIVSWVSTLGGNKI